MQALVDPASQARLPDSANAVALPPLACVAVFIAGVMLMPADREGLWRFGHTDRNGRSGHAQAVASLSWGQMALYGLPRQDDCKKWWLEALAPDGAWQRITPLFDREAVPLVPCGMALRGDEAERAETLRQIRWTASSDFYRAKLWCGEAGKVFQQWFVTPFCEIALDWDRVPPAETASFNVTKLDAAGNALGSVSLAPATTVLRLTPPLAVKLKPLRSAAEAVEAGLALDDGRLTVPACPGIDARLLCLVRDASTGQFLAALQTGLEEPCAIPRPAGSSNPNLQVKLYLEGAGVPLPLFDGDWLLWSVLPEAVGLPASDWVFLDLEGSPAWRLAIKTPAEETLPARQILPCRRLLNGFLPLPAEAVDSGKLALRCYEGRSWVEKSQEPVTPFLASVRPIRKDSIEKVAKELKQSILVGVVSVPTLGEAFNDYLVRWACATHLGVATWPVVAPSFTELARVAAEKDKRWLWAGQAGLILTDRYWFNRGIHALLDSPCIAYAHILHRKGVVTFHEQCLLLNIERWKAIGCPDIDDPSVRDVDVPMEIPDINAHDDYTPAFIRPSPAGLPRRAKGLGAALIAESMAHGEKIANFPFFLRRKKRFLYPARDPRLFLRMCEAYQQEGRGLFDGHRLEALWETLAPAGERTFNSMVSWLQVLDEVTEKVENRFWGWNSESLDINPTRVFNPDYLVGVAAGLKLEYLGYVAGITPATEVIYADVSGITLAWKKLLLAEWDGVDYRRFAESEVHRIIGRVPDAALLGDLQACFDAVLERVGSLDRWVEYWNRYRSLSIRFCQCDLIEETDTVVSAIVPDKSGLVWISNIFNYHIVLLNSLPASVDEKKSSFVRRFSSYFRVCEMFENRPQPIAF